MTKAKTKEADIVAEEEQESETSSTSALFISDHMTARRASTILDHKVAELVSSQLRSIDDMIRNFVDEKEAEGFSIDELRELYSIEMTIPTFSEEDGKIDVRIAARIVERGDDEE